MSVHSISHNRASWLQPISEKVDSFKLQFQGSLVKVSRMPGLGWVKDNDQQNVRRFFRKEIERGVHEGLFDEDELVRGHTHDRVIGVRLSPALRWKIQDTVFRRAARAAGFPVPTVVRKLRLLRGRFRFREMGFWRRRPGVIIKLYRRGKIGHFSDKSRKRLLDHTARLKSSVKGLFVTLTYRENMVDYKKSKKHLDLMLRWIKYNYAGYAIIWRMEEQQRGAIHFHLLVLGARFIRAADLTKHWQKVTSDDSYPDVKRIRNRRQALYYASKYVAKLPDSAQALGFINVPYSEKSSFDASWRGRFWGIINRDCLPLADLTEVVFRGRLRPVVDFRRSASRKSRSVPRFGRITGFTLFGGAGWWLRLWEYYVSISSGHALVGEGGRRIRSGLTVQNISPDYLRLVGSA